MKYNTIDFNNKTILITGGAGFIGSNLAFYFQEYFPDAHIVIFDIHNEYQTAFQNLLQLQRPQLFSIQRSR